MSLEALSHMASLQKPLGEESSDALVQKVAVASAVPLSIVAPPALSPRQDVSLESLSSTAPAPPAMARTTSFSTVKTVDWARLVTLEERKYIRDKIKNAYKRKAPTYEQLLEVVCCIEEELVFASAPSRLDYFKTGVQFEKRVAEKQAQMTSGVAGMAAIDGVVDPPAETEGPKVLKRAKTQH